MAPFHLDIPYILLQDWAKQLSLGSIPSTSHLSSTCNCPFSELTLTLWKQKFWGERVLRTGNSLQETGYDRVGKAEGTNRRKGNSPRQEACRQLPLGAVGKHHHSGFRVHTWHLALPWQLRSGAHPDLHGYCGSHGTCFFVLDIMERKLQMSTAKGLYSVAEVPVWRGSECQILPFSGVQALLGARDSAVNDTQIPGSRSNGVMGKENQCLSDGGKCFWARQKAAMLIGQKQYSMKKTAKPRWS